MLLPRPAVCTVLLLAAGCVDAARKRVRAPDKPRLRPRNDYGECLKTKVAIIGAGTAGVAAAQALSNQTITDFIIVEYNGEVGGRAKHTTFGQRPDGSGPYTVELGANWVQGLGTEGGPENPIWTFAKKWNVTNTFSDYANLTTYNETGAVDYTDLLGSIDEFYTKVRDDAGHILTDNLQDKSVRAGLRIAGWKPQSTENPAQADAVDWYSWDWEMAHSPDVSSHLFGVTNNNLTLYQWSTDSNFVTDQRGFNAWILGEASTFLKENDPRLLLNTKVTNVTYTDSGVTVYNDDASCISADYAIVTVSLGVLQHDIISFSPALPAWKEESIARFDMGTYTKIFYQFNETFWGNSTQFFLYADPTTRGYWPLWQSLSTEGFFEESNIIFATMTENESYRVERQDDETTMNEGLAVLRSMFPDVDVPEPIAFMYPRWTLQPWAYGSYSNWPVGTTLEMHQNLRANVGRVFFAGEATSALYYGFLHGAWYEGREAGQKIAGMLGAPCLNVNVTNTGTGNVTASGVDCGADMFYDVLHGTTDVLEFSSVNGWDVSSFLAYGLYAAE